MPDTLTPEERAAIAAFPSPRKIPRGVSGLSVPVWVEGYGLRYPEDTRAMRRRISSAVIAARKRGQARKSVSAAERRAKMAEMQAAGASHQDIGDAFGIAPSTVDKLLQRYRRETGTQSTHDIAEDRRSEAWRLRQSGLTHRQIAERMGISKWSVQRYVKQMKAREVSK